MVIPRISPLGVLITLGTAVYLTACATATPPARLSLISVTDAQSLHEVGILRVPNCTNPDDKSTGVETIAFSPEGRILAIGSRDGCLLLWEIETNTIITLDHAHSSFGIDQVVFSSKGQLASIDDRSTIEIWDIETQQLLQIMYVFDGPDMRINPPAEIAFSPDGRFIASGSPELFAKLWDTQSFKLLHTFEHPESEDWPPLWIPRVSFSRDSTKLFTMTSKNEKWQWDVETYSNLTVEPYETWSAEDLRSYSPDGTVYAEPAPVSEDPKQFVVKNAHTHETLLALSEHEFTVWQIQFSPDGKLLATGGLDGQVILWGVMEP